MKVTLALLGLGSVAALQLGGSARTHAVQLGGARAPSRTSRVICGWGPDPVWSALEVGSIKPNPSPDPRPSPSPSAYP